MNEWEDSNKDLLLGAGIIDRINRIIYLANNIADIAEEIHANFLAFRIKSDLDWEETNDIRMHIGHLFRCQYDSFLEIRKILTEDMNEGIVDFDIAQKAWDLEEELKRNMYSAKRITFVILKYGGIEKRIYDLYHLRKIELENRIPPP